MKARKIWLLLNLMPMNCKKREALRFWCDFDILKSEQHMSNKRKRQQQQYKCACMYRVSYKYSCAHNPAAGNSANANVCVCVQESRQCANKHTCTYIIHTDIHLSTMEHTHAVADHNPLQVTFLFHYFFTFMPRIYESKYVVCVSAYPFVGHSP